MGFEPLCREVSDSISWQRFCRIPLGSRVPHPTTLMKITSRCGKRAVAGLNHALIAKAAESRLIKMHKLRADTTVVEANVAYPVDSSLLARGIARCLRRRRQRGADQRVVCRFSTTHAPSKPVSKAAMVPVGTRSGGPSSRQSTSMGS